LFDFVNFHSSALKRSAGTEMQTMILKNEPQK